MKEKNTKKYATYTLAIFALAIISLLFNNKIALAALPYENNFDVIATTTCSDSWCNLDHYFGTTYSGNIYDFTLMLKTSDDDNPSGPLRTVVLLKDNDYYQGYLESDCNAGSADLFHISENIEQADTIQFPYYKLNNSGACINASTTPLRVDEGENLGFRVYWYWSSTIAYGSASNTPFIIFNEGQIENIKDIIEDIKITTPTLTCSSLDIACHIKNGFVWLFYPNQNSVDQFSNLSLENKFPFSYAYDIETLRGELFPTATSTFAISVPFGNFGTTTLLSTTQIEAVPYASTIKTILGYILWILFAEMCYQQILKSHNKEV